MFMSFLSSCVADFKVLFAAENWKLYFCGTCSFLCRAWVWVSDVPAGSEASWKHQLLQDLG